MITVPEDACTELVAPINDLNGNIAVVRRGGCLFIEKVSTTEFMLHLFNNFCGMNRTNQLFGKVYMIFSAGQLIEYIIHRPSFWDTRYLI